MKEDKAEKDQMFNNITNKELDRDIINLHLSEPDFIGDGDFEATRKEMLERYGDDFFDEEE